MSVRHYTIEQLLKLRESPLVKKPEDLPAIEQWIEYLYLDKDSREKLRIPHSESAAQQQAQPTQPQSQKDGNTKDARSRVTRPSNNGDASPMGNFSTGQRPSLMQTRSHASKAGDDVVLGPPKTAFSSSSRFARTNTTEDAPSGGDGAEGTRTRTFGERQQNRNTKSIGEKDGGRDWTALRQPKNPADFEDQKDGAKFGRRDRERDNEGERRNGDKQDSRWGQRDERRQNGERQGGWRDRENNRQNRGWDRNEQPEKEPEWFDEPMKKQEEDLGVGTAHTQADFQKWKEMMKGNKAPAEEAPQAQPPPAQTTPAKQSAPIKLDGFSEPMFGGFGVKAADSPSEGAASVAKTPQAKGKSSRFASVFKKEEAPQPPLQEPPAQQQLPTLEPGQGLNEDKAGFQRILQMLGGANIGGPPQATPGSGGPSEPASPQIRGPAAGPKQKSRFFDSAPKSPGEVHSPQSRFQSPRVPAGNTVPPVGRNMVDDPSGFFGLPMSKPPQESPALPFPPSNVVSPEPSQPPNGNQASYPQQNRTNEPTGSGPPSRGSATPDVGIQNLLAAQRAQRPQASNKDSEFLLGLLQGQGPRPASQQTRPNQDFNLWVGQPPEPHAPKPRVPPPPGLIDDQLLRNAPPEMSRHEQPPMGGPDAARRSSQRVPTGAPPGFDEHMFMQQQMQQRRNFGEGPPQPPQPQQPPPNRRMGGHPSMSGMPPQQQPQFPPDFPFMQAPPGPPQGPHQGPPPGPPQGHPQGPPQGPPGFAPNMRHPQGFANGPNIFQAQQQREPPGFGGMMQNPMSPPAPPPGFGGPPPGMPPGLMGMRSPPFEGMPGQRR